MQKIIIVKSMNETPENDVNERLESLGMGWRVVSATTTLAPHGRMDANGAGHLYLGVPKHVLYVSTVVVEK